MELSNEILSEITVYMKYYHHTLLAQPQTITQSPPKENTNTNVFKK